MPQDDALKNAEFAQQLNNLVTQGDGNIPGTNNPPALQPPGPPHPGMVQPGNIDVNHRPVIWNDDGTPSTIFSATVEASNGKFALVPTIANGKFLTPDGKIPKEADKKAMQVLSGAAAERYRQSGEHLGIFDSEKAADDYANATHAWMPNGRPDKVYTPSYDGDSNMPLTRPEYERALARQNQQTPPTKAANEDKKPTESTVEHKALEAGMHDGAQSKKKAGAKKPMKHGRPAETHLEHLDDGKHVIRHKYPAKKGKGGEAPESTHVAADDAGLQAHLAQMLSEPAPQAAPEAAPMTAPPAAPDQGAAGAPPMGQ